MDFENIMLREINQTEKDKNHMTSLIFEICNKQKINNQNKIKRNSLSYIRQQIGGYQWGVGA